MSVMSVTTTLFFWRADICVLCIIHWTVFKSKGWHICCSWHWFLPSQQNEWKGLCEGILSFAQWTNFFWLKKVSDLQLNSIQPRLYPLNISLWSFPLCATLWNCLLICISIRESPSLLFTPRPWLLGNGKAVCSSCVFPPSRTDTLSHPVALCWCWGSPACCVSVPLGKAAMQMSSRSTGMKIGSCFDQSTCCVISVLLLPPEEPIWYLCQLSITPLIQMNKFFHIGLR